MDSLLDQLAPTLIPQLKMESSYKVDEGYSEETRSQDGFDSPMGIESGSEPPHMMSATELSAAVMSLSESDKAGIFTANLD